MRTSFPDPSTIEIVDDNPDRRLSTRSYNRRGDARSIVAC